MVESLSNQDGKIVPCLSKNRKPLSVPTINEIGGKFKFRRLFGPILFLKIAARSYPYSGEG
jgi:hypothetical protein